MSEKLAQADVPSPAPGGRDESGDVEVRRPFYKRDSSTTSDIDYQQALEVIYCPLQRFPVIIESDRNSRRRASMTDEDAAEIIRRKTAHRTDVACKVHQLLAADHAKLDKTSSGSVLTDIPEAHDDVRHDKLGQEEQQQVRSRLLTKRQLSDMAWGVRELSKRLGAVRLKPNVKNIFLLTKAHDESLIALTREMTEWLLSDERDARYNVYVEDTMKDNKKFDAAGLTESNPSWEKRLRYWDNQMTREKPERFDFVVSLGGDGTVLYASWLFQRIVPPVMSFALGSLGFLTKFDFDAYKTLLTSAFREGVVVSLRLRFEGTVMRSQTRGDDDGGSAPHDLVEELVGEEAKDSLTHRPDGTYEILNDIVVDRGPNPTMSSIEVFGDDEHYTTVQADGICVATPTGSTAYNLAAGGSLCHPDNPVILVTAICAHTLNFRPIILPDTTVLRVGVPYDARTSSWASFDGRERVELCPGDYVTVSASRYPFANVMPSARKGEDWVSSISTKLQWNVRERQKSFKEWAKD